MKVLHAHADLLQWKSSFQGKELGFVPTMGALHKGHLSLVEQSLARGGKTLVSIYVNPTQFNNAEDFKLYPNTLENDLLMLEEIGCDAVYLPSTEELYPNGPVSRTFDFACLDHAMEGAGRPGHFEGMATVVTRFFDLIEPDYAIFGEKDYQQLCIVRHVVAAEGRSVEIIPGAIVREKDGLAMSSRNLRLSDSERASAGRINKVVQKAINEAHFNTLEVSDFETSVSTELNNIQSLKVEYVQCCDEYELQPIPAFNPKIPTRLFVAVWCGNVRLIDNYPLF
jgi:pantoate--beta-alanine ligase